MSLLLESLTFGLIVGFMVVGLIGVVIPVVPGTLLIWLSLLLYSLLEGFEVISVPVFILFTLFALTIGTADLWLPLLGARVTGSSGRGLLYGVAGGFVGFLVLNFVGAIAGYAAGIILGEYRRRGNWSEAFRASLGGIAGMGVATLIELGGSLLFVIFFIWRVLGG